MPRRNNASFVINGIEEELPAIRSENSGHSGEKDFAEARRDA
jgi:hypothetical protein